MGLVGEDRAVKEEKGNEGKDGRMENAELRMFFNPALVCSSELSIFFP